MFDPDFDPLKALNDLAHNQELLKKNQMTLANTVNLILERMAQQDKTIDSLLRTVEVTNQANEILMQNLVSDIHRNLAKTKENT